jgi:hypothetical protein
LKGTRAHLEGVFRAAPIVGLSIGLSIAAVKGLALGELQMQAHTKAGAGIAAAACAIPLINAVRGGPAVADAFFGHGGQPASARTRRACGAFCGAAILGVMLIPGYSALAGGKPFVETVGPLCANYFANFAFVAVADGIIGLLVPRLGAGVLYQDRHGGEPLSADEYAKLPEGKWSAAAGCAAGVAWEGLGWYYIGGPQVKALIKGMEHLPGSGELMCHIKTQGAIAVMVTLIEGARVLISAVPRTIWEGSGRTRYRSVIPQRAGGDGKEGDPGQEVQPQDASCAKRWLNACRYLARAAMHFVWEREGVDRIDGVKRSFLAGVFHLMGNEPPTVSAGVSSGNPVVLTVADLARPRLSRFDAADTGLEDSKSPRPLVARVDSCGPPSGPPGDPRDQRFGAEAADAQAGQSVQIPMTEVSVSAETPSEQDPAPGELPGYVQDEE